MFFVYYLFYLKKVYKNPRNIVLLLFSTKMFYMIFSYIYFFVYYLFYLQNSYENPQNIVLAPTSIYYIVMILFLRKVSKYVPFLFKYYYLIWDICVWYQHNFMMLFVGNKKQYTGNGVDTPRYDPDSYTFTYSGELTSTVDFCV